MSNLEGFIKRVGIQRIGFVTLTFAHTSSVYEALKDELLTKREGLRRDVGLFFSLPIPKAVWQRTRPLQNQDFSAFIDS